MASLKTACSRTWWAFKHRLRGALRAALWHSMATRGLRRFGARRRIVLSYHTVGDATAPTNPNNTLSKRQFRRQMDLLRASGRPVVPMGEWIAGAPGAVTLTFDDGYRDCLEVIAPILEEYGFPATFFVCPGFIDADGIKWDDLLLLGMAPFEKSILRRPRLETAARVAEVKARHPDLAQRCAEALLDWNGLRELARRGFAVESHTSHHHFLAAQTAELQSEELRHAKRRLEEELGNKVRYLAYPFGFPGCFDQVTKEAARATGYAAAFELGNRYADRSVDPYEVPRFGISRDMPEWHLRLILSGCFF